MSLPVCASRRSFLKKGLCGVGVAALGCGLPRHGWANFALPAQQTLKGQAVRNLAFHNLHTDEKIDVVYWQAGSYDRTAWDQINHILRDHYSGDQRIMDIGLIDMLHDVQGIIGNDRPIEIISGYRSPTTNSRLREASGGPGCSGVAKNSFHMQGKATDIRFNGTALDKLHDIALDMQRGGVGYYPKSDFVHMDVGPVRRWG